MAEYLTKEKAETVRRKKEFEEWLRVNRAEQRKKRRR